MDVYPGYNMMTPVRVYPESPRRDATIKRASGLAACSLCGCRELEAVVIERPAETVRVCWSCARAIAYLARPDHGV